MSNLDAIEALPDVESYKRGHAGRTAGPAGDPEIKAMIAEVDLPDLISRDLGEDGEGRGDYITYHNCPVCGHRGCFSVKLDGDRWYWQCFSASNSTGYQGGTVLEYWLATGKAADYPDAVSILRELTGHPRKSRAGKSAATSKKPAPDIRNSEAGDGFPPITRSRPDNPPKRSPVLIEGILRRGHKLLVTAPSKAGKTWLMLELAVAVATGGTWLKWKCAKGRVLYVNFEVDAPSQENRLKAVSVAMGADVSAVKAGVDFWHLRGHAQDMEAFTAALLARVGKDDYSLVILDPLYKVLEGDENAAGDVRKFWNKVDEIAARLDCAVAATHHHSKGGKGDVAAIDRGSGSGVFGRDPDAPIDMIRLFPPNPDDNPLEQGASAYRVSDSGLREFPSMEPFNVIFKYPRHYVDAEGLTDGWKPRSSQQSGGNSRGKVRAAEGKLNAMETVARLYQSFVHERVGEEGLSLKDAAEVCGCNERTLKAYINEKTGGEWFRTVNPTPQRCRVVLAHPPARAPEQVSLGEPGQWERAYCTGN